MIINKIILLQKLNHLLSVVRPMAIAINLQLDIATTDVARTIFQIKKNIGTACVINTQKLSVREIEITGL